MKTSNELNEGAEFTWPIIDLNYEDTDKILDVYLAATKDALKQAVEGGRAITNRAGTVATQASTVAVAAFGAISLVPNHISQYTTEFSNTAIYGLAVSSVIWSISALFAVFGMRTEIFGSVSPEEQDIADSSFFNCCIEEAKLALLKVQFQGMAASRKSSRKAAMRLNCAITLMVIAPAVGLLVTIYPSYHLVFSFLHANSLWKKFSHFYSALTQVSFY
jgi:hypothetical protein